MHSSPSMFRMMKKIAMFAVVLFLTRRMLHTNRNSVHYEPMELMQDLTSPEWAPFVRTARERPSWLGHEQRNKARFLFLTHHYEYTNFMDRSFYHQYNASLRHPYVDAVLWGVGLPGWNINLTIAENIATRYGSATYFDLVFLFGHCENQQLYELTQLGVMASIREFECFDARCAPYIEWNNVAVFQLSYMTDIHYYHSLSTRRVIMHSPHCADPSIFYAPVNKNDTRMHDLIMVGAVNNVYPLRKRWLKLSEDGHLSIYRRSHPGYFLDSFNPSPEWSSADAEKVEKLEAQVKQYADDMKRSKIMLTDSSVYRYALMKYIEATMAGCLIIGDIPYDYPDLFRQIVVEVNKDDSEDDLVNTVLYWLNHDEERIERVRRAQQLILPEFTWDTSIDRLIQGANMYRKKQYGIYYSGSFIQSCTAKNTAKGVNTNDWCRGLRRETYQTT